MRLRYAQLKLYSLLDVKYVGPGLAELDGHSAGQSNHGTSQDGGGGWDEIHTQGDVPRELSLHLKVMHGTLEGFR